MSPNFSPPILAFLLRRSRMHPHRIDSRMAERIVTYREFWPHYLREHAQPATRAIHLAGTALATASLVALIATRNAWFIPGVLLGGYGPAWTAHFFVEHNRPATFT